MDNNNQKSNITGEGIVSIEDVKKVFNDVLDNKISREDVDLWACNIVRGIEEGRIKYDNEINENRIWSGVMYLRGIDLRSSPENYLHSSEDIKTAMIKILES